MLKITYSNTLKPALKYFQPLPFSTGMLRVRLMTIFLFFNSLGSYPQSLEHPVIYTTQHERSELLNKIASYSWAAEITEQLHEHVDKHLETHGKDPNVILNKIPEFADGHKHYSEQEASPLAAEHYKMLNLASEAGMLWHLTGNSSYARLSADILQAYIEELGSRTPQTTAICGNAFFDPRTTYPHFALAYDFIYGYLKGTDILVYSRSSSAPVKWNHHKAQKVIRNMAGNVLQEYGKPDKHGQRVSNHPILTAPGALFSILCIEDDAERERLFKIFWEIGTAHQNSFRRTILPMYTEQGLWPESLSYGFMPNVSMIINIIDKIKPELNAAENAQHIFNGSFLYDYLRYPDRRFVRYGDSKRNNDFSAKNYRYALNIAKRHGYTRIAHKAELALHSLYESTGGYHPDMSSSSPYDKYQHLDLFWGEPIPEQVSNGIDFNKKTVIVDHAGIALQRNYTTTDNVHFGLCGIIGGAHYVHSHVTGISMELYGSGYVMAPNAGLPPTVPERRIPLHEHYYRLYAGNNTVVVNGTSHGADEGSWKGRANVWQNTTQNIASEPKHLEEGIAMEFSFATQLLNDTINNAIQQRTLSTIRTSDTTGYYLDVFRSRSLGENNFHDYIYHNVGDLTHITDEKDHDFPLMTTDRYQNDIGDQVFSPGWRYFKNTESTHPTDNAVKVRFDIEHDKTYMHLFIPPGINRAYTKALAPPTREAKNGYVNKKTQTLIIRQQGEAWNRPYMAIFEPSANKKGSVQRVEPIWHEDKITGVRVYSKTNDTQITDMILCSEKADALIEMKDVGIYFEGRFGIIRIIETNSSTEVVLYIGEGKKLMFGSRLLKANAHKTGVLRYKSEL